MRPLEELSQSCPSACCASDGHVVDDDDDDDDDDGQLAWSERRGGLFSVSPLFALVAGRAPLCFSIVRFLLFRVSLSVSVDMLIEEKRIFVVKNAERQRQAGRQAGWKERTG